MNEVELIEKKLKSGREQRLSLIPSVLRKRYKRLEKTIMFMWKLDSVYEGSVALGCFDVVVNSPVTIMELESIIKSDGQKLAKEMTYEKALAYIRKTLTKAKRIQALRNKDDFRSKIKLILSGN